MSREDQVNLISYANLFTSLKFFLRFNTYGILCPICPNSLNRLLPYLGAQDLTIQGRGYCHNHDEAPPNGCCRNPSLTQVRPNWPCHIIYDQMASGHILPSLVFLANSPPHQPPGHYPCFWAWGSFPSSRDLWPLEPPPGLLAQPLLSWGFGPFRPPTACMAHGP
ncbi:hypothetical protein O181_031462 [Austropuccinia psidii MF-1]|uniref:Uncharacterized protein n=1 Tax=Austropuccinia psidii MF-1 TaxID=1389203 RepID=A0A9Q3D0P9_9BASI|nr:hypothetical protein [Austropuccinia psidii MF-1]